MTYTSAELLTIVAALGVLIAAIGTVIVNVIMALKTNAKVAAVAAVSEQTLAQTHEVAAKVDQVHVLADGNLSRVTKSLEVALARIDGLTALVTTMTDAKVVADKLAATPPAATQATSDIPTPPPAVPLPVEIVNTAPVVVDDAGARADRPRPPPSDPR